MTSRPAVLAVFASLAVVMAACSSKPSGIGAPFGSDDRPSITVDEQSPTTDGDAQSSTTDGSTDTPAATLEWMGCDDPEAVDETLECATLAVPLNHDEPDGEQIELALVRVPASDDDRVGAVLFNPGGPGGSGFDYVAQGGPVLTSFLGLDQFDLIGFDPRGVDRSNGIRCLTDAELDATVYLDDTPDTPDEEAALKAANDQFDEACLAKYGDTLQHYSTDATARDMDAIRAALGDDQISYLGISYGTYLGATYATLFPDRVRAMVLDSAYEPTGDSVDEQYTTQIVGFEEAFDNWAGWCQTNETCAFTSADVPADWDALSAQLDAAPVTADDGRLANDSVMSYATTSALYSQTDWPVLGNALADVREGDPTALFGLADAYIGRADDGTFDTIEQSGGVIRCASGIDAEQPDDPAALVARLQELAPRFSRGIDVDDFIDGCATLMPDVEPQPLRYEGDAAMVVIGGTNDPATPFRWAEETDEAMGEGSRLVTYTGEGHGFLLTSNCVTEIEAAALAELVTPDEGTVCEPDPEIERPEWWDDLPTPEGLGEVFDSPEVDSLLGLGPTFAYSELRTSALGGEEVLDAYDLALEDAGFQVGGRSEPSPGLHQAVYLQEDGDVFSVLAIGSESFDEPDLEGLADLVPVGQTLVISLTFPA